MIRYVAGFLFDPTGTLVLLIEKKRPTWMAGMWNGIGGKIESGETPEQAMTREFEEETGLSTEYRSIVWEHFATITGVDFEVTFFAAMSEAIQHAFQQTDEVINTHYVGNLYFEPAKQVANLPVLIALALDRSGTRKPVLLHDDSPPAA